MSFTAAHRGGTGEPLVLLHGFTDTWRTWELVLPALEARHDVLAPTLPGHAGGPPLPDEVAEGTVADAVEAAMDEAGFETAHVAGNSLGGYVALQLAARGRARSVVAIAPAGGWEDGDPAIGTTLDHFPTMQAAAPDRAAAHRHDRGHRSRPGPRDAVRIVDHFGLLTADLVAHALLGAHLCTAVEPLVELGAPRRLARSPPSVFAAPCAWSGAPTTACSTGRALRSAGSGWLPGADWIVLDEAGHCPQLERPLETAQLILGLTDRG